MDTEVVCQVGLLLGHSIGEHDLAPLQPEHCIEPAKPDTLQPILVLDHQRLPQVVLQQSGLARAGVVHPRGDLPDHRQSSDVGKLSHPLRLPLWVVFLLVSDNPCIESGLADESALQVGDYAWPDSSR